jgi:hypothetical protein
MPTTYKRTQYTKDLQAEIARVRAENRTGLSYRNNHLYLIFQTMLYRCCNPNFHDYRKYGAKGIKICDRWLAKDGEGFKNFLEDVGPRPEGKYPRTGFSLYRLSRKDLNGDFSPENCSWKSRGPVQKTKGLFQVSSTGYLLSTESQTLDRRRIAWKLSDKFGWCCWYCGISLRPIDTESQRQKRKHSSMVVREIETHIDHVVPIVAGGTNDIGNLALACEFCNRAKLNLHLDFFLEWMDRVKFGNSWIPIRDGKRSRSDR